MYGLILIIFQLLLCFHRLDFLNDNITTTTTITNKSIESVFQSGLTSPNTMGRNDSLLGATSVTDTSTISSHLSTNISSNVSMVTSSIISTNVTKANITSPLYNISAPPMMLTTSSITGNLETTTISKTNISITQFTVSSTLSVKNMSEPLVMTTTTSIISVSEFSYKRQSGDYRYRIRTTCSFPDLYYKEYDNISSEETFRYLKAIFNKLAIILSQNLLFLNRLIVYSVKSGSVIVDMSLVTYSKLKMEDQKVLDIFKASAMIAYNNTITILSMKIEKNSDSTRSFWIAGLILAGIILIILIAVAIYLFRRYQMYQYCCKSQSSRSEAYNNSSLEMEYDTRTRDTDIIINQSYNQ